MLHLLEQNGLSDQVRVDSAGTAAYHIGSPPDERSAKHAARRGIALPSRGRQFKEPDFEKFDYVLAMDSNNFSSLKTLARGNHAERLYLLRDFDPASGKGSSVPDPYYGGADGFEEVLDQCLAACQGLLDHLVREHGLKPQ